jgi:hypothetical protein
MIFGSDKIRSRFSGGIVNRFSGSNEIPVQNSGTERDNNE